MRRIVIGLRDRHTDVMPAISTIALAKLKLSLKDEVERQKLTNDYRLVSTDTGVILTFRRQAEIEQVYLIINKLERMFGCSFAITETK